MFLGAPIFIQNRHPCSCWNQWWLEGLGYPNVWKHPFHWYLHTKMSWDLKVRGGSAWKSLELTRDLSTSQRNDISMIQGDFWLRLGARMETYRDILDHLGMPGDKPGLLILGCWVQFCLKTWDPIWRWLLAFFQSSFPEIKVWGWTTNPPNISHRHRKYGPFIDDFPS